MRCPFLSTSLSVARDRAIYCLLRARVGRKPTRSVKRHSGSADNPLQPPSDGNPTASGRCRARELAARRPPHRCRIADHSQRLASRVQHKPTADQSHRSAIAAHRRTPGISRVRKPRRYIEPSAPTHSLCSANWKPRSYVEAASAGGTFGATVVVIEPPACFYRRLRRGGGARDGDGDRTRDLAVAQQADAVLVARRQARSIQRRLGDRLRRVDLART